MGCGDGDFSLIFSSSSRFCLLQIRYYRISLNKRRSLISAALLGTHIEISASLYKKYRTSKCGAYWNSYHILLVAEPKCKWNQNANNKTV